MQEMQERPCGATDEALCKRLQSQKTKPPTLQASIVRPAGGSRPLIGSNL